MINKHWIVFYLPVWVILMSVFGLIFTRFYFNFTFFGFDKQVFLVAGLIITLYLLYKFYIWHNNALIITSERLIAKDQYGLFSKRIRAMLYEDIIDISYIQKGMTPVLCNYGTLIIRMSSGTRILLKMVPDPWKAVEAINQLKLALKPRGEEKNPEENHGQTLSV
ncbi:MAG: hypothetical protein A2750_01820 [Candidatus Yanofskybacteria bacterium RIFCSPHIGHO2_01_FULL_45_42]|nr:MAG: hypothetical protein A2750_01820 [Candidatus Yanofskybacteria bacterium RIFCSPHIGHO2_01_FULL_45_42]